MNTCVHREWKAARKDMRRKHGVQCEGCKIHFPKADPTVLLPGQKCRTCGSIRHHDGTFRIA